MRIPFRPRSVLLGAVLLPLVACTDEIPTVIGDDAFPVEARSGTFEVVFPADALVTSLGTFSGYTGAGDAPFSLVANAFEGVLRAHTLLRFDDAPEPDSVAAFDPGTLLAPVDTAASVTAGVTLQLWALDQPWSTPAVSWERATDTTLWREPGGTRGALLAEAPAAPSRGDSVSFALDSADVRRIADPAFPGLLITATGTPGRVRLGPAVLRTAVRTTARPDTTVDRVFASGRQRFIFTPEPPEAEGVFAAGGVASARSLFRLRLPDTLQACDADGCGRVPLRDVTINSAALLLQPAPVPNGFGPLGPTGLLLRVVAEPDLGRFAPLGRVAQDSRFAANGAAVVERVRYAPGDSVVAFPVGQLVRTLADGDSASVALALLGEPAGGGFEVSNFGVTWFAPAPRLRLIYTVPARPMLP